VIVRQFLVADVQHDVTGNLHRPAHAQDQPVEILINVDDHWIGRLRFRFRIALFDEPPCVIRVLPTAKRQRGQRS
jgi:hypothetical protein